MPLPINNIAIVAIAIANAIAIDSPTPTAIDYRVYETPYWRLRLLD